MFKDEKNQYDKIPLSGNASSKLRLRRAFEKMYKLKKINKLQDIMEEKMPFSQINFMGIHLTEVKNL